MMKLLPEICASRRPGDDLPILIRRGVVGYWLAPDGLHPEHFNKKHRITEAVQQAMLAGSMFGWDVPAATPKGP